MWWIINRRTSSKWNLNQNKNIAAIKKETIIRKGTFKCAIRNRTRVEQNKKGFLKFIKRLLKWKY